jgi:hypothetical protein
VVNFSIGKQKVIWILKLRENGWEAAASALRVRKIDSKFWSQFSLVGKFCKSQATFL